MDESRRIWRDRVARWHRNGHSARVFAEQEGVNALGTPEGRFGIYIPAKDLELYFSTNARLLPPGQLPSAAAYAELARC